MSYSNDILEAGARRSHDFVYNTTIDIFDPTLSDSQTGIDVSYPGTATKAGVEARYEQPEAGAERDEGGTDVDLDALYLVRDDAYDNWDDYDVQGDASTRIEDQETAEKYDVKTVVDERDGRVVLGCVEVD